MARKADQTIEEIKEFLDLHLSDEHSILALCNRFSINREKLQNGFRESVNFTVRAYIIRQRIERAAQKLRQSNDPIKSIAFDSGYKKQRSFNKTFKAVYGVTPATYRRTQRGA